MPKVSAKVPANTEYYGQYRTAGKTSPGRSLNCSVSGIEFLRNLERAEIITRLLYYLRNEINFSSVLDDNVSLEELRLHVTQCVIKKCLRFELASQGDEVSYFSQNITDLAVLDRIMASLTCNDASEVMAGLSDFGDVIRLVSKLFGNHEKSITAIVDVSKIILSAKEFRILMNVGMELILNSVRHAFYSEGTGQVSVSLKEVNNGKDVEFLVVDNGCGPQKLNFGRGLRLVTRASAAVSGDITIRQQACGGTGVALRFPAATARPDSLQGGRHRRCCRS
jgi:two-component sensor histidine kinase